MELKELQYILSKGEGTTIEFKQTQGGVPKSLYETIASFSNTDGGVVVLGAEDDGTVIGIPKNNHQSFIQDIVSCLHSTDSMKPAVYLQPSVVSHPGGDVIVIRVPVSSVLIKHHGAIYWRSDDNDQNVTSDQQKVSDIYYRKRDHFTERTIYPFLTTNDFDSKLFDKARKIISLINSGHPWLTMSNEEILSSSSLYFKDFKTGEEGYSLAAALIFGKDETISNLVPGYKVDALVRRENIDRYDDRLILRTNLIDTYLQLMDFIKKHIDEKFYQEGSQRKDLRELIFREVIGNIIVHREYTSAMATELIIYKDKVVVTNPNKALFHGPLDPERFSPYPKNPLIRKFFTAFGWTDELGSGVRNTNKFLKEYTPGAKPVFIENDTFQTEIPLVNVTMANYHKQLVEWFNFNQEVEQYLQDSLTWLPLPIELYESKWDQVILYLVPSWAQNGTKLDPLDWPRKQVVDANEIKKVPSWSQDGAKVLHRKTSYLIRILFLTLKPISLNQLMQWMVYANRQTFRENYLIPLQQVGFVKMTKPNEVNAPDQKYVITEKGKLFLTGRLA